MHLIRELLFINFVAQVAYFQATVLVISLFQVHTGEKKKMKPYQGIANGNHFNACACFYIQDGAICWAGKLKTQEYQ